MIRLLFFVCNLITFTAAANVDLILQNIKLLPHVEPKIEKIRRFQPSDVAKILEQQKNPSCRQIHEEALAYLQPYLDQTDVIDKATMLDLELVIGQRGMPTLHLASMLDDGMLTVPGRLMLLHKLLTPTDDIDTLTAWQQAMQTVNAHCQNWPMLDEIINELRQAQNLLLSFKNDDYISFFYGLYHLQSEDFFSIPLPKSLTYWLNTTPWFGMLSHLDHTIFGVTTCRPTTLLGAVAVASFNSATHAKGDVSLVQTAVKTVAIPSVAVVRLVQDLKKKMTTLPAKAAVIAAGIGGGALALYVHYRNFAFKRASFVAQQEKMMAVAQYVRALRKLQMLIEMEPLLAQAFKNLSLLDEVFDESDESYGQLLRLLSTGTFVGEPSYFFSYAGNLRAATALFDRYKARLLKGLVVLAEADVLRLTAQLIRNATPEKPWSYASFDTDLKVPYIHAEGFWHPYITSNVVLNSIEVGTCQQPARSIIISGPNAGGKTTLMKALLLSALLAQSLGIVSAQEIMMTPFAHIVTYLNITDDLLAGKSLFKAGVARALQILQTIQQNEGEFSLVGLDELFNSTSVDEGAALAYAFSKAVGQCDNVLCIGVTHFPIITILADQDPAHFKNYKTVVIKNQDGTFEYTFKLEQGVSDQNIAFDILEREGFGSSFIQDALNAMHEYDRNFDE